jgi:cation diffusion facilitator CzcD-associated flavoprotein CzcO
MKTRLAKKPELVDQLMPSFPPLCRRLTPGPGYLEALVEPNVDVISTEIREIVEDGIITEDGIHRPVEAIMCATGFDTSFTPRYPIYGINNLALSEKWKTTPSTYLSITADQFPNFFVYLGPNSGLGAGNLLVLLEKMADYFTECASKIQRENIASMCAKPQSVERFVGHCDKYFERTVFTEKCRSWYKNGTVDGRVSALWPGEFSFPKLCIWGFWY